ncbi:inter-alpha-trypsin inhibitor heavy chain H3-like [Gastrophryne carolinensis]
MFSSQRLEDAAPRGPKMAGASSPHGSPDRREEMLSDDEEQGLAAQLSQLPTRNELAKFAGDIKSSIAEQTCGLFPTALTRAIKASKPGRAPGPDGFPTQFYKIFSDQLAPLLARAFESTASSGTLPGTALEARIVVIPKEGKDPSDCKSYRPISLLNVDIKIFAKILADRLGEFLPSLVGQDQVGFVPGREARDNVIKALNIQWWCRSKGVQSMMLSTDAEKAFDRVDWGWIGKVLEHVGLGAAARKRILALYSNPIARVKVNDCSSPTFHIRNGTRQGCPLSPLIFALSLEPFLRKVDLCGGIRGVLIGDRERKVAAYADDMLFFLRSPRVSVPNLLKEFEVFGQLSNLKINFSKSSAMNISLPDVEMLISNMGYHLLVYTLLLYVLLPANGDFLIEGLKSIQPEEDIEVYSINIDSKVTSRFAHNVITSRAVNRANVSKEAVFKVDLPKTAFITNFSMIIDGKTYSGIIKEKEAAKKQYQTAVSRGQTAGLVKASGRKTEKFTVSVNIAAQSKVSFELVYEELLKRHLGKYEMFIKVQPKTLVRNFQIEVNIYEPQGISFLDAQGTFVTNDLLPAIHKTLSDKKGYISFKPSLDQQRSCETCPTTLLDGDFTVTYDVNRQSPGNIQVVNGYFVHFFAPAKLSTVPKNVIYVIDRSGSMAGRKIQQTREALLEILKDTAEHDHFNFITFDHTIEIWKDSLVKATPENLEEAKKFVRKITDEYATNINDPLLKAVELLDKAKELKQIPEKSVSLIILLTDGKANMGETEPSKIEENVKKAIQNKYTLYCLGFGYEVDYGFLEKMALDNSGIARRIYEDSDAALQMQGFYSEVANPTLMNIEMQYPEHAIANLTRNSFKHYYDGSEIVVAGRIIDNDLNIFSVDVKADGADNVLNYAEEVQLQDEDKDQAYIFGDFTERLWAYQTIQQLLEKRVSADASEKESLKQQALDLSLKYQFVTPLTSMVVTKPEEKEKEQESLVADKLVEVDSSSSNSAPYPTWDINPTRKGWESLEEINPALTVPLSTVSNMGTYHQLHRTVDYARFVAMELGSVENMKLPYTTNRDTELGPLPDEDEWLQIWKYSTQASISTAMVWKLILNYCIHASGHIPSYSYMMVDSDPHFVIHVPSKNDFLCFNIQEEPGVVLNLVEDQELGIAVNGELIGNKKTGNSVASNETYFGKIGIVNRKMKVGIEVSTNKIVIINGKNKKSYTWGKKASFSKNGFNMTINKNNVTLSFGEGAKFVILLHKVWKGHPLHRDFLGFYTIDHHKFSGGVHGLLGQFFHGIEYDISNIHKTSNPDKPDATMKVKNNLLTVTRGVQRDYRNTHRDGNKVACWFVHSNGEGLIDGTHKDYIVPDIFSIA